MSSFFDSNVLVYTIEQNNPKRVVAERLLTDGGVVSVQVLNEFVDVARRKFKLSFDDVGDFLESFKYKCRVVDVDLEVHELGFEIASQHLMRIYDANIIAAAELADCDILYTEDLNHGQRIGGVSIVNPFKVEA